MAYNSQYTGAQIDEAVADVRSNKDAWNGKQVAFTVTLPASGWNNNTQTISNAKFIASGYAYTVSPEGGSFLACNAAIIYVDNVTEAGKITFHCVETPTEDLTMNILRTEVSA